MELPTVAVRTQRRPLLLVASLLLLLLGGAGGALAWFSIGTAVDAVVARTGIARGQLMAGDDFVVVQVNPDPQLQTLTPDDIPALVGRRAAHDVAAGGLVPGSVIATEVTPTAGRTVIGLSLGPGFHPGIDLLVGDAVRIVMVEPIYACAAEMSADPEVDLACEGGLRAVSGVVASVTQDPSSAQLFLGVEVDEATAPAAAAAAALGKAAVVLDSRER